MATQLTTRPSTTMAVAGDWHGDVTWSLRAIAALPDEVTLLIHLGDFGLMGTGFDRLIHKVHRACVNRDLDIRVLPGNHENHAWIARQPIDADGLIVVAPRIRLYPRGYRFTVDGVSFCAVGGAVSVDQGRRTWGKSWWPEEEVTEGEADAIAAAGHAAIMLCHDAPLGSGAPGLPEKELIESAGRAIVDKAYLHQRRIRGIADALTPDRILHGHMHSRHTHAVTWAATHGGHYNCTVDGLACNGMTGNLVLLTVNDGDVTVTDIATPPHGRWR